MRVLQRVSTVGRRPRLLRSLRLFDRTNVSITQSMTFCDHKRRSVNNIDSFTRFVIKTVRKSDFAIDFYNF